MAKFKAGDTAWVKVVLAKRSSINYPLVAKSENGDDCCTFTPEGKFNITDERQTLFTEDEVREILGAKPKDEMRYFYVNFYVKDAKGGGEHVSIPITHTRMFSLDGLRKYFASAFHTSLRAVRLISWQELTKDDYEAFTA